MVQIVFSQDSYTNRSAREGLPEQEQWILATHVKARTQLLKRKKEGLTLDERRICIKGERALRLLVEECRRVIWAQIYRFNFDHRTPTEELYQIGLMCVELAANSYSPNRPGKRRNFKGWVSLKLRSRLFNRFDTEFRYHRRGKAYCDQFINTNCTSNTYTPLDSAINKGLRDKLDQIITTSLTDQQAKIIQAHYWQGRDAGNIATHFGINRGMVRTYLYRSRKQLRENPQIKELAESVLSTAPNY